MSASPDLGRLEPVELRESWSSEAQGFTPWLAEEENIELLGQAIGINLSVDATEKQIGDFRADIICRDVGTDRLVLIENQVEPSDHRHLGQILTYAAGADAAVIVWIVSRFRSEHRAAIDWLNGITRDDFYFFGIEIELWRIGNSLPAPRFNVVVEPNEWERAVAKRVERARSSEPEGIDINRVAYWQAFEDRLATTESGLRPKARPPRQGWYHLALTKGASLYAFRDVAKREIGVYLGLHGWRAAERFEALRREQDALAGQLGESAVWLEKNPGRTYQIALRLLDADALNEADWPRQHTWLIDGLERLRSTFLPVLERIDEEAVSA